MIWARIETGPSTAVLVPVETCAEGAGDLALDPELFAKPGELVAAHRTQQRTRYRSHRDHCPARMVKGKGKPRGPYSFTSGRAMGKARP